jgi:hypothetical protein
MYGKLGVGNEQGSSIPVLVDKLRDKCVINVACGSRHTVALSRFRKGRWVLNPAVRSPACSSCLKQANWGWFVS